MKAISELISKFTVFYGGRGGGKTLAAVIAIKDILERDKQAKVVSDIKLNALSYEAFNETDFLKYRDRIVFIDIPEWTTRIERKTDQEIEEILDKFFENNNKLIITVQNLSYLRASVIRRITSALRCEIDENGDIRIRELVTGMTFIIQNKEDYYRFYSTTETLWANNGGA